ncbi:malto-oligosyltrehalose synthase [Cryptosporangium aurantiacum]|uniref:Maltooligosyl trehalose synthase n=1 Tax=Cryptosporangium aurantiacum TaxID=134849 RepID=A0A1M7RNU6_9ACTN|nr:malto-oligosyltrehalose synthase [Cryptosporangium aurantiacum]SHN48017.1 maltooligosyl trehalose synthase [Cryptosporangium aurantiacum]
MGAVRGTYRVQVQPAFDLGAAAGLADYLADLGATQLYSAPLLQSAPGSAHGYDVVDHSRVNTALGGASALSELVSALRAHGLGLVVDIVPNHAGVAVPEANPAWWDVLKRGRESDYARWFDIDWDRGPLLIPVLGSDDDVSALTVSDGELHYYEHRYPLAPGTEDGTPEEVHDRQHYRLVDWRRGDAEITYRRFFAITDLAGLRVEDPTVFNATHGEILRWYAEGDLDGIRVDHPDGLRDPGEYLQRLRIGAPDAWLVVEKIAEPGEALPEWPIDGLTGYDALGEVGALFVDPAGEDAFTALDTELTGVATDYPGLLYTSKKDVATGMLRAELRRLARLASGVSPAEPVVPDVSEYAEALSEILAVFPVYRSYLPFGLDHLASALVLARENRPDLGPALDALEPRLTDPDDELAIRFQQTSGAVMAKGAEDTAFYRWTRFVALNEVGGDPTKFGGSPAEWHAAAQARQAVFPRGMTTLSTHDTKRSEDVRARLAVLSELPDEWADAVRRWRDIAPVPDGAIAHLLYQSVAATWPIEASRLREAMRKSAREARTVTSWNDPNEEFEAALDAAVEAAVASPDVVKFAERITPYGWVNALGQKLVQLTMPGIPDTYQGTELWDNSLVDPDNRRPVDFDARRKLLARLDDGWLPPVDAEGAAKLLVTSRALRLRRDRPELFSGYTPVSASGSAAAHAVAFDRGGAITVATRLPVALERRGGWGDTVLELPDGEWTDALTGAVYSAGADGPVGVVDILSRYPVALLTRSAP